MRPSLGAPRKKWMENRWRRRRRGGTGETAEEREEYKPMMPHGYGNCSSQANSTLGTGKKNAQSMEDRKERHLSWIILDNQTGKI